MMDFSKVTLDYANLFQTISRLKFVILWPKKGTEKKICSAIQVTRNKYHLRGSADASSSRVQYG